MTRPNTLDLGGRLKFLAKDTVIYGLGGALNKVLALITFPLLARHFSVADYGLIDLLNTSVVLLVALLVFGQDSAVARFFYETTDVAYRRQVVSQSLAFQAGGMVCVLPLVWVGAGHIGDVMSVGEDGEIILKLTVLQAPFFLLVNFSQNILKWTFQRRRFLFVSVGSAIATMIGIVIGTTFFDLTIAGVFIIYLAARAVFGLVGLWFVREWLTRPTDWDRLREMMPFAVPFGVICALSAGLPVMERSMVQSFFSTHELGLFAAGAKVALLIGLPINAFEMSWGPFSLALFKEKDAAASYQLVLKGFTVTIFGIVLGLSAFAEPIVTLLGSSRYEGAGVVVFGLAMGLAVQAIGSITSVGIVFSKKSYLVLYSYGAMVLVAAVAIPLLSMNFGLAGVAWGSLAGYLTKTIVETWLAQRAYPLDWNYTGPSMLAVAALLIGLFHQATFGRFEVAGLSMVPLLGVAALVISAWHILFDAAGRTKILSVLRFKPST